MVSRRKPRIGPQARPGPCQAHSVPRATDCEGRAARRAEAASWAAGSGCLAAALVLMACGGPPPAEVDALDSQPGYPEATSRLTLRLDGEFQKLCHATLVDRRWALTAAHCLSDVDPEARGALNDFERSLAVRDVAIHPG